MPRAAPSPLGEALRSLESGKPARALDGLLDVWRKTTDPRLGELISQLGASLAKKVADDEWDREAKLRRPEALSGLLASAQSTAKVMKERALVLGTWAPDPRLDRWVVTQYEKPPFTSTGSGPFWTALKKLTVKLTDPVARSALAKVKSGRLEGVQPGPPPPTRPLSAEELADVAAVEAALTQRATPSKGQRTTTELLAEVLANPAELTLRHVLMDALLEQGHPRGQLLALQLKDTPLTAAEKKREKALIAEHWDELLGPLAPALKPDSRFARGFLVHAELRAAMSSAVDNALTVARGHALWRTVESFSGEGSVLAAGEFPLLRAVDTWRISLAELARFTTLESLSMRLTPEDLRALTSPGMFPALNSLGLLLEPEQLPTFETWAQARPWRALKFTVEPRDLALYCALLARPLARSSPRLEVNVHQSNFARTSLVVSQTEGKTEVALKLELPRTTHEEWSMRVVNDALALLEALASRPGLHVEVTAKNVVETVVAPLQARAKALNGGA